MRKSVYTTKTKIICTVGPAINSTTKILRLIKLGADSIRLNFSHGTYDEHISNIKNIRHASFKLKKDISILQDLQGPKIRTGEINNEPIKLETGSSITLTTVLNDSKDYVLVNYDKFHKEVKKGDRIFIDDGKIRLIVEKVIDNRIICKVLNSGELYSNKGINLPNVKLNIPALTEKDREDVIFGLKYGVDIIALSFVRSHEDIGILRDFLCKHSKKQTSRYTPIIAKIEKREAVNDLEAIIKISDGILIARGDLGIEIPLEDVPLIQKEIIRRCREYAKPVIVATQMLESMIKNPLPTRAEVSDIANAVLDGTDAVLLSGETAIGKYPFEAVDTMNKILYAVEKSPDIYGERNLKSYCEYDALARSAVLLAKEIKAKAIVTVTYSGRTAMYVSKFRPKAKIIAVTEFSEIARMLNLVWGIEDVIKLSIKVTTDLAFKKIHQVILENKLLNKGDEYVILAGLPFFKRNLLNTIKVFKV